MAAEQVLFVPSRVLPFGKYKGKSIAEVYCGSPTEIIITFAEFIAKSIELIFSKELYSRDSEPELIDLSRMNGLDTKKVSEEKLAHLAIALRAGARCDYELTSSKFKAVVYDIDDKMNRWLSQVACEVAQEYMTRSFTSFIPTNGPPGVFITVRENVLESNELTPLVDNLENLSGSPSYIHWCIRKLESFCMPGNKLSIDCLDSLPIFSFDSVGVKAERIKDDFSFKMQYYINADFKNASKEVVALNYDKYSSYLEAQNQSSYSVDQYYNDDDEYYDSDDEDNIMRGLANGDGDSFGF